MTPETSGRKCKESDPKSYSEEGGGAHYSSQSSGDNKVTTSSKEHLKGEMRLKKRHDAGCVEQQVQNNVREEGSETALERGDASYGAWEGVEVNGWREVMSSYFDVALLIRLPATGKLVAFERSEGTSVVEEVLKEAMEECVYQERQRIHNIVEMVGLFRKLYTLLVVSWLFFPRCTEGVA
ncbi:hypothetical protein Cgig2_030295 [Carnegiea gigantea]|uniref:Uncharacterized protein n=1 Tax=Carnegiea gigantea TaxID=171969 RepID=A0A9Q1JQF5_9CARY|nr:hypothetical protein Cgig2_030295 [Carnegiea gigantea]